MYVIIKEILNSKGVIVNVIITDAQSEVWDNKNGKKIL
jgi:hypothetical protein